MRILQVNKFYAPAGAFPHVGGVETVVRQLAEGLPGRGHQTRVLTCDHEVNPRSERDRENGVEVWRAATFGILLNTALSPTFPLLYREAIDWADLAHFHAPSPVPELTHLLLGVPTSTPVVVTFHADPGTSRWKGLSPLYAPVQRRLLRRANRITATAPANIERTDALSDFAHKTDVVPLATEFDVNDSGEIDRASTASGPDERPTILFVGRLAYYKGLTYLLRAMQTVAASLVIVGDGDLRQKLSQEARDLGVDAKVTFAGYVPDEELSHYYRTADLFVLPSVAPIEAFGIVQLDAMAHGLPVVNTDLPTGVPFVSPHEETGLTVDPEDPSALAAALSRLVENPHLRQRLGRNARERAASFTEDKMIDRYDDLYREVTANKLS